MTVPVARPLFDGVIVAEPYRYLDPPAGAAGSPPSASSTLTVAGGASPAFAAYTSETPPQAELLGHGGEFSIPSGTTTLSVTIVPIPVPADAPSADIAGNLYRFSVTDQAGTAVTLVPGQTITLALRAPSGVSADATIARYDKGAWQDETTEPSGLQDLFITNVSRLGDFAVLGPTPVPPAEQSPILLIAAVVVAGLVGLFGVVMKSRPKNGAPPSRARRGKKGGSSRRTRGA